MAELTKDQVRDRFMDELKSVRDYWLKVEPMPVEISDPNMPYNTEYRMNGLIHSILANIDGEGGSLPAFKLIPFPCPEDKGFCQENKEDWYPVDCDIAGDLHNEWSRRR